MRAREGELIVHRLGVVHHRGHALLAQHRLEGVAVAGARQADGVLRPGAREALGHHGERNAEVGGAELAQQTIVALGAVVDLGQLVACEGGELLAQHRRLEGVEPAVHAHAHVVVLHRPLAMDGVAAHERGPLVVVREDGTAVAVASERLGREEARRGDVAERAGDLLADPAAEALGAVLEHQHALGGAGLAQGDVVRRQAKEVDGNKCAGGEARLARHGAGVGDAGGVDVEGVVAHVDEHRGSTDRRDDLAGGEEGEVRDEDGIARPDTPCHERQLQRIGPVAAGDAVGRAHVGGELGLERRDLLATDVAPAHDDAGNRLVDGGGERGVLGPQVAKLHDAVQSLCEA